MFINNLYLHYSDHCHGKRQRELEVIIRVQAIFPQEKIL